ELKSKLETSERELGAARGELSKRDAELKASVLELKQRESELKLARARTDELADSAERGVADELGNAERQLQERGHEVRRLERDLRAAERTGRELVRELARRTLPSPESGLVRTLAEREADLRAAEWTIDSLTARVEQTPGEDASRPGSR
ncbi:MAG TPA: hypothetical protein VGM29_15525, partial [Polyangiaceae bacterium]